ncbi:hypothetical protein ACIQWR_09080 [Streptomyces sp. NPDC098789]|uniref:hypothetical protein n=1 Tax=Streptomyces sp. NPDC098789 TaxID=3366098 RepID=UPI003828A207
MSARHTYTGSGEDSPAVRDLVGIGFGPADPALATAATAATEHTHGPTSSLLPSGTERAVRARRDLLAPASAGNAPLPSGLRS